MEKLWRVALGVKLCRSRMTKEYASLSAAPSLGPTTRASSEEEGSLMNSDKSPLCLSQLPVPDKHIFHLLVKVSSDCYKNTKPTSNVYLMSKVCSHCSSTIIKQWLLVILSWGWHPSLPSLPYCTSNTSDASLMKVNHRGKASYNPPKCCLVLPRILTVFHHHQIDK